MIEVIALIRLVPYILVAVIAIRKRFYRLSGAAAVLVLTVALNKLLPLPPEARDVLAMVLSWLLLLHALNLKPRQPGENA